MKHRLQDLIDIEQFQELQDRLNEIYSFPSAIIDNDGNILTATAWQDICTKFHRKNRECERECVKSDQYIVDHVAEADPAVTYRCPHGLVDNATPIVIDGEHVGNFFTGQFFLEAPDPDFFRAQAKRYGFDEEAYLEAVRKVPIWSREQLHSYLYFIRGLIEVISGIGLKNLRALEAGKAIEANEKMLKTMFDLASIGMAQTDPRTGQWVRVNRKMCDITGYSADEMLAMRVPEITHPEDRERDWKLFQRVVRGETSSYRLEKRYIRKDGAVVWVNVNMTVLRDDAGEPVRTMATIEDITDRKRAELALRESEERYEQITKTITDYIYTVRVAGGRVVETTHGPGCEGVTGYRADEFADDPFLWFRMVAEEDRAEVAEQARRILAGENSPPIEHRIVHKNGTVRWVRSSFVPYRTEDGVLTAYDGLIQDITERKRAEEALRKSQQITEGIMNAIPVRVFWKDKDLVYLGCNEIFARDAGFSDPKEIVGKDDYRLGWSDQAELYRGDDRQVIESGRAKLFIEEPQTTPAGDTVTLLTSKIPLRDSTGEINGVLGTYIDITEHKRAEEALRESETRFQQLFDHMADGVAVYRAVDDGRDFVFVDMNRTGQALTRTNLEKAVGRRVTEVFPDVERMGLLDVLRRVWRTGQPAHHPLTHYVDGHLQMWVENYVYRLPSGLIVAIYSDTSEQRRAEEALRESEERNRTIIQAAMDGFWLTDLEGRLLDVNESYCRMSGYSAQELLGMRISDLETVESETDVASHMQKVRTQGEDRFESRHRRKDGSLFDVEVSVQYRPDEGGRCVAFLRDITEHKRAEEALRASEEKHRRLFETMAQGVVYQGANDEILSANPAAERILGLSFEQMQGKTSLDPRWRAIREDGSPLPGREHPSMVALRTGKPVEQFVMGVMKPDAQSHTWISVNAMPLFRPGESTPFQVYATFEDITERRRAEQNYQTLFREMLDGFALHEIVCDEKGVPVDYRFLAINPAFERMTGLKAEQIIGRTVLEAMPGTERSWIETYGQVALTGEPVFFENYSGDLDKYFEVTAFRPAPKQFACIFSDVTDRKRSEKKLSESHALLDNLARMVPGVVYQYCLYPDGRSAFPYASPGMNDIYEVTPEEVREDATPVFGRLHPEDHDRVAEAIYESARTLKMFYCEFRVVLPRQGLRWRWSQAHPQRMEDGGTLWHGIISDITDRKLVEEEKERLQEQLMQSQKMESVGRLAGGVAHDFNNMLGVILGHTELALETTDSSQPLLGDLQEIRKAAERSAALTRQLLAFARKQTVAPRVLDLNETVEGMLSMLRRLIGEDIDLAWLPGQNVWPVKMDPSQIDQILANLCVNARDAIAGVGRVTIETGTAVLDESYCAEHAEVVPGDYVILAVSDTGCGMDKEILSHLFEPFFTTKGMGKGTGLGLATLYGIVKQNEGSISVYSEPGQGTTLKIYLPRHAGRTEAAGTAEARETKRGRETVLLVEDEPGILKLGKRMLESLGYFVLAAGTPGEAIRLAEQHAGEIHLLMTDVVMPEMNGRDLAKNLLSFYPNIKRLFMSGYTANVIAHHGVLDAGVCFIQKPFSKQELAGKLREALETR